MELGGRIGSSPEGNLNIMMKVALITLLDKTLPKNPKQKP
jgi:hypothetical protein